MPGPTRAQRNVSKPLTDMTIATMQEADDFIGLAASPIVVVPHKEGSYYEYDSGAWHSHEMQLRGSSEKSARAGWVNSNTAFKTLRYSLEHPEDWSDKADADTVFSVDQDSTEFLGNQANIHVDYLWTAAAGVTGVWDTDWDGVAAGPAANQFIQFDQAASDPQKTVNSAKRGIKDNVGKRANLIICGADVFDELQTNAVVRASFQYTGQTTGPNINEKYLAEFFGVDEFRVAQSFYNSAKEGQTEIKSKLFGTHDMWIGYVNPNPGKKKISACYTFAFSGAEGVVAATDTGISTWKYQEQNITSDIYGVGMDIVVAIIATGAGAFLEDATA